MKRSTALGLVAAAVVTTAPAASAAPAGLEFGPCPEDIAGPYPQMRCAELSVPLDYADPGGEQIELLVSKLPARKPESRRGSLLVNPGGPGGPGVAFAGGLASQLPAPVRDSYDLIGFDTRNSGHSQPITCADPEKYWRTPLPDPDSPAAREANWQRAAQYAAGCQERAGKYLPHLTTPNNARDVDRIRAALGEQRISFLGYSYGTYLGAVYGEMFGRHVDRMILDSSVNPDPSEIWYGNNLAQDVAAQRRLEDFYGWVAQHHDHFGLGTEPAQVRAAWEGVRDGLRRAPRGPLGPAEFLDITFDALYSDSRWQPLAKAIAQVRLRGEDQKLVGMVERKDAAAETSNAIYTAVECADAPWPRSKAWWERDSARMAAEHPFAAWYNSWTVAPCRTWPAPSQQPMRITGTGLPPVLMFNSEHDAATPYRGAQEMHRSLPSSVLVTEKDAGEHGVWALAGNDAADRIGTAYLLDGELPAGDVAVPGHPLPDPGAREERTRTVELR
ncbi:alpha/beta hydrolase [Saccharopolyspora griseoalba]|uniref:Alpha/beta hydrolase n=1 Tax=Saccharopolyspora griseoalba TaxID=1431848 RepID=A0ABW2LE95_9PSEU